MANIIKVKRSATPSAEPTTANLELGELAINTYDGKLYIKKDNGTQSIVQVGSEIGTVTSVSVVTANGMSGTVANATTTPAITLNAPALGSLSDVILATPVVNQLLGYNGAAWVNTNATSASAGTGVLFYNATPSISPVSANNDLPILTLPSIPVTTAEQTISGTAAVVTGGVFVTTAFSAFASAPLNRTIIDAGVWDFTTWINVSSNANSSVTTLTRQVYSTVPFVVGTVTITGTGTSRTATASSGTPFATSAIDPSAVNTDASYLQTPLGVYQITARTSDTVVTITTPTGYTNESAVAGTVWKKLFGVTTPEITTTPPNYIQLNTVITQPSFPITVATGIAIIGFVRSDRIRTITITYNGTTRNTHVNSPLANVHNDLAGLQGGVVDEYYHSTAAEYTGTGSGVFVRATSPTLTTPALGTPSALVGTNITGTATAFTASNVTTNANLTGVITSAGNTTSIASQTGTGSKFVVDTSPTLITPALGTPSSGVLTNCTGLPVAGGGTGLATLTDKNVILGAGTSTPTFVAPSTTGNVLTSNGTTWVSSTPAGGGATLSNDTTTATPLYPMFAAAITGTPSTVYTSNSNYLYTPSTGALQAKEVVASNALFVNNMTVTNSYTIPAGNSASSIGAITIASGAAVTIPSGSRWVIL
jgi:hypothetical protein